MQRVSTGMEALDAILNGGLPRDSITMIIGAPGTGKTILTLSMLFANATPETPVLYFTTVSEPATKVLKYQQEFTFFDPDKFNTSVIFVDIAAAIKQEGLEKTIEIIKAKIEEVNPFMVAIDSFKGLADLVPDRFLFRGFVHDLSVLLSVYGCTTLLAGEYTLADMESEPEFAIADGIISLNLYSKEALASRVLRVHKMRGTNFHEGEHAYSISEDGVTVFPRLRQQAGEASLEETTIEKVSSGIPALDKMLDGGFNEGFSTMIAGSAGTGKTTFAVHFMYDGLTKGEPCLLVDMEESPSVIVKIAASYGIPLAEYIKSGQLTVLHRRPVDLNVYHMAQEIRDIVTSQEITRVAFDAISDIQTNMGNEQALRDYIFSLVGLFETNGITSLLTNVIENAFGEFKITEANLSVVVDSIILLRYVEIDSSISKAISILKMRGSNQDKALRRYEITSRGIDITDRFEGYGNVILGSPSMMAGSGAMTAPLQDILERVGGAEKPGRQVA